MTPHFCGQNNKHLPPSSRDQHSFPSHSSLSPTPCCALVSDLIITILSDHYQPFFLVFCYRLFVFVLSHGTPAALSRVISASCVFFDFAHHRRSYYAWGVDECVLGDVLASGLCCTVAHGAFHAAAFFFREFSDALFLSIRT